MKKDNEITKLINKYTKKMNTAKNTVEFEVLRYVVRDLKVLRNDLKDKGG